MGSSGLLSLKRGRPSNHRHDDKVKLQTLAIVHEYYADFGPTLAHEKLAEVHDIHISLETLRQWMIADGLWVPHAKRKPRVYQPRHRRDCLGELIQIDGSHHNTQNLMNNWLNDNHTTNTCNDLPLLID
ncbi:hypothetical protein L4D75_23560 [Photobacterium indicum]